MTEYEINKSIGKELRKQGDGKIVPLPPNFLKTANVSPQNSLGNLDGGERSQNQEFRQKYFMTNIATHPKKHVPHISKERIIKIEEDFTKSLNEQLEQELNRTKGVTTVKHLTMLND